MDYRQNMKTENGFTLVEVIVVAVIVAILSIGAVTMYNGYIKDTRTTTVQNIAEAAAASANAYVRKTETNLSTGDSAKLNLFFPDPTRFTVTITPGNGFHGQIKITEVKSNIYSSANY